MKNHNAFRTTSALVLSLAMFPLAGTTAYGQNQKATIEGLIIGRDGPTMSVQTADSPRLTVVLSDTTKATEKGGFLGLGRKDPGITALVPGLPVKVEGSYDGDHKLLAEKVIFTSRSLRTAKQIDAGLNPVARQLTAAQDDIMTNRKNLEMAQQGIDKNSADIAGNTLAIGANSDATSANRQAIGKTNNRFSSLDQFETKGDIVITFKNGKATVAPKDRDQLTEFVKAASDTPGFMIQVQGYASTTGSPALNQKLSAERAEAVLSIIQQSGAVPLTRILAPAAMGTSQQVGDNHTRSGQAQNRRVVVTILVNKGING